VKNHYATGKELRVARKRSGVWMFRIIFILFFIISTQLSFAGDKPEVADWPNDIHPLKIGDKIPNAIMWTGNGDPIHLRKLVSKKPTILLFYQGNWSPYCTDKLHEVQEIYRKLKKMGFQVLAISPDSPYKLRKYQKKYDFKLLSDYHLETAMSFGIVYRVDKTIAKKVKIKYGAELRQVKGEDTYNLPVPGVFVVDTEGKIQFQYVNPNYEAMLSMGLLLEAAKMLTAPSKR
jgi:peroxiredoxin